MDPVEATESIPAADMPLVEEAAAEPCMEEQPVAEPEPVVANPKIEPPAPPADEEHMEVHPEPQETSMIEEEMAKITQEGVEPASTVEQEMQAIVHEAVYEGEEDENVMEEESQEEITTYEEVQEQDADDSNELVQIKREIIVSQPDEPKTVEEMISESINEQRQRKREEQNGKGAIVQFDDSSQEAGTVVVVATDDNGKEIILHSTDSIHEVTVQQVQDESGQIYLLETMDNVIVMEEEEEEEEDDIETVEIMHQPPKNLPRHVLGRNIVNPSDDPVRNGKAPPKPRLGVKVPYRNLTSQIVSKQEITNEILERSRRFQKDSPKGQNLFAKKLTQTLAKKLAPNKSSKNKDLNEKKLNNSDLIAILEGDGDTEPETETKQLIAVAKSVEPPVPMTKAMEREIALKQLSELPEDPPEEPKDKQKAPPPPPVVQEKPKEVKEKPKETPQKEAPIIKKKRPEDSIKAMDESAKKAKRFKNLSSNESTDEENPRFSSNMPLKTYTRKRKPSDETPLQDKSAGASPSSSSTEDSTKKIDLPGNSNNYMTKSSRIIKKKIIWDPAEVSPKKQMKTEVPSAKEKPKKAEDSDDEPIKPANNNKEEKEAAPAPKEKEKKIVLKSKDNKRVIEIKSDKLAALKYKKRLTEVDKLLMDEGAVNMLYSIKNDDDQSKKKPKSLVKKTNELLNDLQTNTERVSPKALRKKENIPTPTATPKPAKQAPATPSTISRQKSKDSNRSSIQSPPPSPGGLSADDSRIIRRHSSSSFSSGDDNDDKDEKEAKKEKKKDGRGRRKTSDVVAAESPKKRLKKETVEEKREKEEEMEKNFLKLVDELEPVSRYGKYKTFDVLMAEQLMEIVLIPNKGKNVYINIEMMQELVTILKELETDHECNIVVITSSGSSYTKGIDYKALLTQKETVKKSLAKKLASNIRDFLLALTNFPKILVAGVHGDVFGVGVTMLPLFDMIVVTETATFSTPYAEMGCMAEGGSLFTFTQSPQILVSELLYSSNTLKSSDALRLGLATKIIPEEDFETNLWTSLKDVSNVSIQFLEATKKQVRQRTIQDITDSLNSETDALVQQWVSSECQKHFADKFSA